MAYRFSIPGSIVTGAGALEDALDILRGFGTRAFVVCDPLMVALGNLDTLTAALGSVGIAVTVYSDITGEPTDTMIAHGVELARERPCDMYIGLGGGSPIDAMKAIACMVALDADIDDQMGATIACDRPPLVAIPTTAGTGSEVTRFTIISNTRDDVKMLLAGPSVMPDVAIVDPRFTLTAPPVVTANAGVDALCHALEAATSKKMQPMSYTFSISAIKRIFASLAACWHDGGDVVAREQMAIAATEAGIAFSNASVTVVHGMSRPIGALFHVPHGLSNAMIVLECLRYVVDGAYPQFAAVARDTGLSRADDDETAARELIDAVAALLAELEIPTLREHGIDEAVFRAQIPKMAADAMASGSPGNTIKPLAAADLEAIYGRLISA